MGERNQLLRRGECWLDNKLDQCGYCFGGKGDTPPAPDYEAAAEKTAAGNLEAARVNAKANRVSQYTPYGNLIYQQGGGLNQTAYDQAVKQYQDQLNKWNLAGGENQQRMLGDAKPTPEQIAAGMSGGTGQYANPNYVEKPGNAPETQDFFEGDPDRWSATVQLTPEQQQLLDYQNQASLGLGSLMNQGVGYVQNMLSKPFDQSKLPSQTVNAGQTGQDAIMARLQPQLNQENEQFDQMMANQGIAKGTQAYENANRAKVQGQNDRLIQAAMQGINIGNQARQQSIQEQSFFRNEPLNTLNAVRTGAQVTNPSFINTPQQAATSGPDYLSATTNQYNAAMGQANADAASGAQTQQGIIGIASIAAMAF